MKKSLLMCFLTLSMLANGASAETPTVPRISGLQKEASRVWNHYMPKRDSINKKIKKDDKNMKKPITKATKYFKVRDVESNGVIHSFKYAPDCDLEELKKN